MGTRILQVMVALAGVATVLAVAFVVSFRTKFGPVMAGIRRLNKRFTNPRVLAGDAGEPGAYASVVHHRGRRSGAAYRTPVVVTETGEDAYVVALPYGPGADWVRNVVAAGGATIDHEGRTFTIDRPELVRGEAGNRHFPTKEQTTHRRFGVSDFLLLHDAGRT